MLCGYLSPLKLFNCVLALCIWESFPPVYFWLPFPQFPQPYIHLYNHSPLYCQDLKMVCRGLSGERWHLPNFPAFPNAKTPVWWEKGPSLQLKAHTDLQQKSWPKSIHSVFRWEKRNLLSLLFTHLDQLCNNLFFSQKWESLWGYPEVPLIAVETSRATLNTWL